MNSQIITDRAMRIAKDIAAQPEEERATAAFRKILLRDPSTSEVTMLTAFVQGLSDSSEVDVTHSTAPTGNAKSTGPENDLSTETLEASWQAACQTLLMTAEFRYAP
jgi:hypothetical protein